MLLICCGLGELYILGYIDSIVFLSVAKVPVAVVPLWLSIPNFIWYALWGIIVALVFRVNRLLWSTIFIFIIGVLVWRVRYPDGIWVANEVRAYAIAFFPIIIIPIAFAFGVFIVSWYQRRRPTT